MDLAQQLQQETERKLIEFFGEKKFRELYDNLDVSDYHLSGVCPNIFNDDLQIKRYDNESIFVWEDKRGRQY
jgi:hypothetical protein